MLLAPGGYGPGLRLNIPKYTGQFLTTKNFVIKMSVMPRLRNSALGNIEEKVMC